MTLNLKRAIDVNLNLKRITEFSEVHFGSLSAADFNLIMSAKILEVIPKHWEIAMLATVGVDIISHIKRGGGFVLTDPPETPKEQGC